MTCVLLFWCLRSQFCCSRRQICCLCVRIEYWEQHFQSSSVPTSCWPYHWAFRWWKCMLDLCIIYFPEISIWNNLWNIIQQEQTFASQIVHFIIAGNSVQILQGLLNGQVVLKIFMPIYIYFWGYGISFNFYLSITWCMRFFCEVSDDF